VESDGYNSLFTCDVRRIQLCKKATDILSDLRSILELPRPVKRLIPAQIKRPARSLVLAYTFRQAMRELVRLPTGTMPSRDLLIKLRVGWDNLAWDAKLDYLEEILRRALVTEGPILECGSGMTTLLLGQIAGRRGVETWSLEHHDGWHRRVSKTIDDYRIPGVHHVYARLRDYGEFNWYDPPFAHMPREFGLVVCDGPPLATGGRYGLLPVLGERIKSGAVILFDDAREASQPKVLQRWTAERGVRVELRETQEVSFAIVTCP